MAAYLRSLIEDEDNLLYQQRITVIHFHEWAKSILGRLPNPHVYKSDEDYDAEIGDRLLAALEDFPLEQRWDAVFVDEAHTFAPNWFHCCVAALKNPEDGDLMIVSDGSWGGDKDA